LWSCLIRLDREESIMSHFGSNSRAVAVVAALLVGCSAAGGDGSSPEEGIAGNTSGNGGDSAMISSGAGGSAIPMGANGGSAGSTSGNGGAGQTVGAGGSGVAGGAGSGAGGAPSSDGGKTGAGGSIITQVADCQGLGAVGKWESLPIPGMDAPGEFVLDPRFPGTIYVGAAFNNAGIHKSTDCGATWQHVSTGRNSDKLQNGRCTTFQIDRNNGTLYTNSLYGTNGIYKSTNGGVDWDIVTPPTSQGFPDFVGHIDMDPDDPSHLLSLFHTTCAGTDGYAGGVGCFAETKNGGATWIPHYNNNPSFPSEVMVYLLRGDTWVAAVNGSVGLMRTLDAGKSWAQVSSNGGGGHSTRTTYRAKNGAYYIGVSNGILRSPPGSSGASWTLLPNTGVYNLGATGNGTQMFVAGHEGVRTSPEEDGVNWTLMPGSPMHSDGCTVDPNTFDNSHNLLYLSCFDSQGQPMDHGFWRVRLK
jgi:hypothetical protein